MANVLISIGNSDDKLSQTEWSEFIGAMRELVNSEGWEGRLRVHGEWFSRPDSPFQNANWCVEIDEHDDEVRDWLRYHLRRLAGRYRQDSIAWTEGPIEFLDAADVAG